VVGSLPLTATTFSETLPGEGTYQYELIINNGDPSECLNFPLRCRGTLLGAHEFFSDDFEGYQDDFEFVTIGGWRPHDENQPVENATWTITNPGGRGNPATENGTASTGQFAISDSDHACCENPPGTGMSHDLWSPV